MGKGVLNIPGRVIATCFVIIAFVSATIVGLVAGNPLVTILQRAIVVMLCAYPIGKILGHFIQKAIDHYIADFKAKYPIPDEYADPAQTQDEDEQNNPSPKDPAQGLAA